ncbi:MAG: murein biosynthesis integral membrane protein MurJ [Chloroflexota bacterium]
MKPDAAAAPAPAFTRGRLVNAALLLSASFVLSRVLGLLRNVLIAAIFGNSHLTDAYFAAFNIPDTIYALISGGALASAFVPVFAGLVQRGEHREAQRVGRTVMNSVFVGMALLALIGWVFTPQIMSVLVGGYPASEQQLTVQLTRIMLLQPIFLGVQAIVTSILQTYNRFFLTALAPLAYSLAAIFGALLGSVYGISALAWSIVIGALAYLVIQLPGLSPEFHWRPAIDWHLPSAREVLRLFGPRVAGLAAFRVMLLITVFLASRLPTGSLSAINYAWVLIWFPVSALGTAAATAIFPTLSRLHAVEDTLAVRRTVHRSLRLVIFLSIPAAVGLIILRGPIVILLYAHGAWTVHATEQTSLALLFYAMAIPALAAIEILPRVFYAMHETAAPVKIAIVAVTIDAILSVIFVLVFPHGTGQGGLALATAIASTIQILWLASALEGRLGPIARRDLVLTLRDALIASFAMAVTLYVGLNLLTLLFPLQHFSLLVVVVELAIGVAAFATASRLLAAPELDEVRSFIRPR